MAPPLRCDISAIARRVHAQSTAAIVDGTMLRFTIALALLCVVANGHVCLISLPQRGSLEGLNSPGKCAEGQQQRELFVGAAASR